MLLNVILYQLLLVVVFLQIFVYCSSQAFLVMICSHWTLQIFYSNLYDQSSGILIYNYQLREKLFEHFSEVILPSAN